MAGDVSLPVGGIQRLVLDRDVRRVPDDGVILLAEDAIQFGEILRTVDVAAKGIVFEQSDLIPE